MRSAAPTAIPTASTQPATISGRVHAPAGTVAIAANPVRATPTKDQVPATFRPARDVRRSEFTTFTTFRSVEARQRSAVEDLEAVLAERLEVVKERRAMEARAIADVSNRRSA